MLKKITQTFLFFLLSLQIGKAQSFLTVEFLEHFTNDDLAAKFLFITTFDFGADVYKVTYLSTDLDGNETTVSGLLSVPDDLSKTYPLACYQHGTAGFKQDVPSGLGLDSDIPIALAGKGYVTVAPDLLGLGVNPGIHPYVHAASAVWVAVDMMRAARVYASENNIFINNQVFVTGYSQGGHSAMALHRFLETELSDEFEVTAAAPMSGPYSISGVMRDLILSQQPYTKPGYLINTFISYQHVYGDIYPDIQTAFRQPYQQIVEDFSNDLLSLSEMDTLLANLLETNEGAVIPLKLLKDSYVQAVVNNPDHPMNLAMQANDVYDWAPIAPTRLYYCDMDEEIPFQNSILAETKMTENGATDVQAISASPVLDHFLCAFAASLAAVDFFAEYQIIGDAPLANHEAANGLLQVYPNPANDDLTIQDLSTAGLLQVVDLTGKTVLATELSIGNNKINLSGLGTGFYLLRFLSNHSVMTEKIWVK